MSVKLLEKPNAPEVLTKAVLRAAEKLDISQAMLAKVLGVSPLTISSLYSGAYMLDECRKEWELHCYLSKFLILLTRLLAVR